MPRVSRDKGVFCTYHIIQRGNEKKDIFFLEEDRDKFINILDRAKNKYNFLMYAYCLMNNHVHLLLNDNGNDISQVIKSINISYVSYFNRTYKRCGHLFQDRFKSELIMDDNYLIEVSRYIHNNPVKACIVQNAGDYEWSSYNVYTGSANSYNFLDTNKVLNYFSNKNAIAVREYIKFVTQQNGQQIKIMDVDESILPDEKMNNEYTTTVKEAIVKLEAILKTKNYTYDDLSNDMELRNSLMKHTRENSSLTLKQIGQIFGGISESRVSRIFNR